MQVKIEWAERFVLACTRMRSARRQSLAAAQPVYLSIPDGRCWAVRSGYVKLLDAGTKANRFVRLILGRGGLFGDRPFGVKTYGGFTPPRHEQAITHGPAEVIELDRLELEVAAKTQPEFAAFLIESATTLAEFLERRLRWQFAAPVRIRVAITLRDLICFEGQRCRHGNTIDVRLTHEDLAELVGAARPVISAELARLRDECVISYTRSYFCVDDLAGLNRIAGD
jgi:CRP-like cAMP-binding protein